MQPAANLSLASLIIAIALFVSACSSGSSGNGNSESQTGDEATADTNFARLETMREESGDTKEFALAQFVAFFGPLASAPEYTHDDSMPVFATRAMIDLLTFKDELDPTLRDEVYQRIFPTDALPDPSESENTTAQLQTRQVRPDLSIQANQIADDIGARMGGFQLAHGIEVILFEGRGIAATAPLSTRLEMEEHFGEDRLRLAGIQSTDPCWILIYTLDGITGFELFSGKEQQEILAHEVMHCFQYEMASIQPQQMRGWISEGTATWAGQEIAGGTNGLDEDLWPIYEQPVYNLFSANEYAAVGFWSHAANTISGDLWTALPSIFSDATGDDATDLTSVLSKLDGQVIENWPTGKAMKPEWGPQWESIGVGGRQVPTVPAPSGTEAPHASVLSTASFGTTNLSEMLVSQTNRDVSSIVTIESTGIGQMHWSDSGNSITFGGAEPLYFCLSDQCVCDDGEPPIGFEILQQAPPNESLIFAMTGEKRGMSSTLNRSFAIVSDLCEATNQNSTNQGTGNTDQSDLDSCLFGQWYGDLDFIEQTIRNGGETFQPGGLTGVLSVNFSNDGTATSIMDLVLAPAPEEPTITLNGDSNFNWIASNGVYQTTDAMSDLAVNLSVPGQEIIIPVDTTAAPVQGDDLFGVSLEVADYLCNNEALIVESRREDAKPVRYLRERLR